MEQDWNEIYVELLQAQKKRLQLKVERQAVQITRLESSRRTLRKNNKTLREKLLLCLEDEMDAPSIE